MPGVVLYLSAEDDKEETTIRLVDICKGGGIDLKSIGNLRIAYMAGEDAILANEDARTGIMRPTPLFDLLRENIDEHRPKLVILDNLADIFAGNENSRSLARQFVGMLRGVAIEFDTTIVIAAHPSLSGISSGTGTSGNTAWNNSVRSRLYLKRQYDRVEEITDPDFRKLVTMKANYGAADGEIVMRYDRGRFVQAGATSSLTSPSAFGNAIQKAELVFLALLRQFNDRGRNVSPSRGANYAPNVFAEHPNADGVSKRQFQVAMDTLFDRSVIMVAWTGKPSRQRQNIVPMSSEDYLPEGGQRRANTKLAGANRGTNEAGNGRPT